MNHLRLIQFCCVALLIGLLLPRLSVGPDEVLTYVIICLAFFLIKYRSTATLILSLCFYLGFNRGGSLWSNLNMYNQYFGKYVTLEGIVIDDAIYGYKKQVEFYVDNIRINENFLTGKARISGYGDIDIKRGDVIKANGNLRHGYGSYQASLGFADYELINRNKNPIENFRHRFIASTYSVIPEPQASLGLGFLAGFRSLLPEDLTNNLSATGLTHIVAVSGYNTTIIAAAIQRSLAKKLSRFSVVMLTMLTLGIFLAITGQAPSIVRACAVSVLGLASWYYGRSIKPSILILVPAAITAYWSPLNYWFSLGWWLSFLAFFGILVIAPTIFTKFKKEPNVFVKTAIETTSAQLMTLPLIIWVFGKVSVISVLANILVLPIIPIAMLTTFAAGICNMYVEEIGFIFFWSSNTILQYITDTINSLARIPWAMMQLDASKQQMFIFYALILIFVWVLRKKIHSSRKQLYTLY